MGGLRSEALRRGVNLTYAVGMIADDAGNRVHDVLRHAGVEAQRRAHGYRRHRLHDDIRTIAARVPDTHDRDSLGPLMRAQGELAEKIETLTLWMTRLDERLAALPAAPPPARHRKRRGGWSVALVLILAVAGIAALAIAGGLPR